MVAAALAAAAVVEEEEEEGVGDRNGNRLADSSKGLVMHGNRKDGDRSAAPRAGRMTAMTPTTARGGIGIVLCKASQIFAMTARLIATNPVVVAELGMAVAAAAAVKTDAVGTSKEKMEEEEIQRQRRIYADGGRFCFKVRLIIIEYVEDKADDGKELFFRWMRMNFVCSVHVYFAG